MTSQMQPNVDQTISISATGLTVERDGLVLRFDAAGRLARLFDGCHVYRRGLDNTMVETWWSDAEADGTRVRRRRTRRVSPARRDDHLAVAYETVRRALRSVSAERVAEFVPAERETVRRVLGQSPATLGAERPTVRSIYEPVGVLPPDQYGAVVLQATTGCPYDCSFCTLYDGTDYTVRSVEEFAEHATAVRSFFGRGLRSRRTVFLGDADPLAAPADALVETLDIVAREFPRQHENGVYAFVTARTAARTPRRTLARLADRGLERLYVGVESGDETVLELLRKPQTPATIRTAIERVKAAGVGVGAIVLAGVGGRERAEPHVSRTADLLASLPLDAGDVVYVSPFVADEAADYDERLRARSLTPMGGAAIAVQAKRLRDRLSESTAATVSRYHVAEFVYR